MRSCQLVGLRYLRQSPKRYSIKSPSTYERLARWPVRSPSLTLMEKTLASSPLRIWWPLLHGPTRFLASREFVDQLTPLAPQNSFRSWKDFRRAQGVPRRAVRDPERKSQMV